MSAIIVSLVSVLLMLTCICAAEMYRFVMLCAQGVMPEKILSRGQRMVQAARVGYFCSCTHDLSLMV